MKTRWIILVIAVLGLSGVGVRTARAEYGYAGDDQIRDWSDFYEPLAPLGRWVQVENYGWCWYPSYVDSDWRPCANGYWMWTEDGWYWMSDEPWAWATYHYGRWTYDSYYGWLWVPGTEWAPSWVAWREGGDYVGWAPLPPSCVFAPQATTIYVEQVVFAPNTFVFVERSHFCERVRPANLIVNQTIVNKTVNVTKIHRVNNVVVNNGPRVDDIQRGGGRVPYAPTANLRVEHWSGHRPDFAAPRERVDRSNDRPVVNTPPQNIRRRFDRNIPVVRALDGSRDTRPAVATINPPATPDRPVSVRPGKRDVVPVMQNVRGNDDRGRGDLRDRPQALRDGGRDKPVRPAPTMQSVADNNRYDSDNGDVRQGRDIGSDATGNRRGR